MSRNFANFARVRAFGPTNYGPRGAPSRGAAHVTAVDTGYGALAWKLRNDARVTVLERKGEGAWSMPGNWPTRNGLKAKIDGYQKA